MKIQTTTKEGNSEYTSWNDRIEVTGETILSLLAAMDRVGNRHKGVEYLAEHGISTVSKGEWYPLRAYLGALRDVYTKLGDHTMYMIGLQIPQNSIFPPAIKTFEDAMTLLDAAYQANHRGGYIGHFKYTKTGARSATMECKRTYGTMIDKGVLVGLSRKFKPEHSIGLVVTLDETKPHRAQGADSHTFHLKW